MFSLDENFSVWKICKKDSQTVCFRRLDRLHFINQKKTIICFTGNTREGVEFLEDKISIFSTVFNLGFILWTTTYELRSYSVRLGGPAIPARREWFSNQLQSALLFFYITCIQISLCNHLLTGLLLAILVCEPQNAFRCSIRWPLTLPVLLGRWLSLHFQLYRSSQRIHWIQIYRSLRFQGRN